MENVNLFHKGLNCPGSPKPLHSWDMNTQLPTSTLSLSPLNSLNVSGKGDYKLRLLALAWERVWSWVFIGDLHSTVLGSKGSVLCTKLHLLPCDKIECPRRVHTHTHLNGDSVGAAYMIWESMLAWGVHIHISVWKSGVGMILLVSSVMRASSATMMPFTISTLVMTPELTSPRALSPKPMMTNSTTHLNHHLAVSP